MDDLLNRIFPRPIVQKLADIGELKNPVIMYYGDSFYPKFTIGDTTILAGRQDGNPVNFKLLQSTKNYIMSLGFKTTDINREQVI